MDQRLRDLPEQKKSEARDGLTQLRASLGTAAERVEGAQKLKTEANAAFSEAAYPLAVRSYLTALWLLKPDDLMPPRALSEPTTPSASALQAVVGDSDASEHMALQQALLLNVAAAALRLDDWPMARCACDHVLHREPTHSKALYRLAQAHEGTGQLADALEALRTLLKHEPANRDAARLAASIRARSGTEKKMFGGLFEKAQRVGGGGRGGAVDEAAGLYSDAALRAEAQRRKQEKDALLTPENLAKLPTDQWSEVVGSLEPDQMSRMMAANAELAKQLPDGAWQKHAAALSPENLETARQAVALHKAQQAQQQQAEGLAAKRKWEEEEEDDDDDYEETWIDRLLTRVGFGMLGALFVAWVVGSVMGFGSSPYILSRPETPSVPAQDLEL